MTNDITKTAAADRLRSVLTHLKIGATMAQLQTGGEPGLAIMAKSADGGGRITMSFECKEFFADLDLVLGPIDLANFVAEAEAESNFEAKIWHSPIAFKLVATSESESFRTFPPDTTGLPLGGHLGAFGVARKHHVHEGVDLYCPAGTPVHAVEDGVVVAIIPFTGSKAMSPWWHDTDAILIEGATGVVVYGEVETFFDVGDKVHAGEFIATVRTVLKIDKGRPMSMLHLELHEHGARDAPEWPLAEHVRSPQLDADPSSASTRPSTLRDPTGFLYDLTLLDRKSL